MAELINLQEADKFFARARSDLDQLAKWIDDPNKGVWSDAQRAELRSWLSAIANVFNTLSSVMNHNRDGRGTPPARPKPNSMMDRIR